jgi:O-antigen/teichoic acid export membrane protein
MIAKLYRLIPKSNEGSAFIAGASVYFLFNIASAALQFLAVPVFARLMPPERLGLFGACLSSVAILSPLIAFGTSGFVALPIYRREDAGRYISTALQCIIVSFILHQFFLVMAPASLVSFSGLDRTALFLAMAVAATQAVNAIYLGVELARRHSTRNAATSFLISALSLVFGVAGLILPNSTWHNRIAGILLAQIIVMIPVLYSIAKTYKDTLWRADKESFKHLLLYSLPLLPHLYAGPILSGIDRVMLLSRVGPYSTGIYTAALTLSTILEMVFVSANSALVPHIAGEIKSSDQIAAKKRLLKLTISLALIIVVLPMVAAVAFTVFSGAIFGDNYAGVDKFAFPIAVASSLSGLYYLFVNYLFLFEKTGRISLATISSALIKVGLLLVLIPSYGAMGAAVASAVTNFILVVWILLLSHNTYPLVSFKR